MKRNPDLEREILLLVEADNHDHPGFIDLSVIDGFSDHEKGYHVLLLYEAGLIDAIDASSKSARFGWHPERLTMVGHEYLEAIRDPEIWRKTKEGAGQAGSFSLEVLSALAKGLVKQQIKKLTGVEINL